MWKVVSYSWLMAFSSEGGAVCLWGSRSEAIVVNSGGYGSPIACRPDLARNDLSKGCESRVISIRDGATAVRGVPARPSPENGLLFSTPVMVAVIISNLQLLRRNRYPQLWRSCTRLSAVCRSLYMICVTLLGLHFQQVLHPDGRALARPCRRHVRLHPRRQCCGVRAGAGPRVR